MVIPIVIFTICSVILALSGWTFCDREKKSQWMHLPETDFLKMSVDILLNDPEINCPHKFPSVTFILLLPILFPVGLFSWFCVIQLHMSVFCGDLLMVYQEVPMAN